MRQIVTNICSLNSNRELTINCLGMGLEASGWDEQEELQRDMKKLLGILYMFIILTVVMVSWVYVYVYIYIDMYVKTQYILNICIYYMSIISQ